MNRYDWSRLTHLQLGRYAEYFVKMEFTLFGFDVYSAEVDDKGIDFVIRRDERYYDVQVKSVRKLNSVFFPKSKSDLHDNLLAAVTIFQPFQPPELYLIPAVAWYVPDALLVSRDYAGKQSAPEWGLNLSQKNMVLLERFAFDQTVNDLF